MQAWGPIPKDPVLGGIRKSPGICVQANNTSNSKASGPQRSLGNTCHLKGHWNIPSQESEYNT